MGNCASGMKKRSKDDCAPDERSHTDTKPAEDVMYASIDHISTKGSRATRAVPDDDCDYATVQVREPEPDSSSREEAADDYVLMG